MGGSVALLSPAAAIPKCVHMRTWCYPSPPLPRERGCLAKPENARKEMCRQGVCGPSAFCSGALLGLGTRAGHRIPTWPALAWHREGVWLAWWNTGGGRSHLLPSAAAEKLALHKFTFSVFLVFFVLCLIPSLGSRETAVFCWDSCTSFSSLICCRNHRRS